MQPHIQGLLHQDDESSESDALDDEAHESNKVDDDAS